MSCIVSSCPVESVAQALWQKWQLFKQKLTLLLMCRLFTGWSLKLVKLSSTETQRDDKTEIVRVKVYDTERPPPVTRFNSSVFGRDVGNVLINCQTCTNITTTTMDTTTFSFSLTVYFCHRLCQKHGRSLLLEITIEELKSWNCQSGVIHHYCSGIKSSKSCRPKADLLGLLDQAFTGCLVFLSPTLKQQLQLQ